MRVGKRRYRFCVALLLLFLFPMSAAAAEQETALIPMGITAGIRLDADGLLVLGMAEKEDGSVPEAYTAGLRSGDLITHIGSEHVTNVAELRQALQNAGETITLRFLRGDVEQQICVRPVRDETGQAELGVYLRSSVSGIGTITFYDVGTGRYGALGHGVSDGENGILLPAKDGSVGKAVVESVMKGNPGEPGELRGSMGLNNTIGRIDRNTGAGIFGVLDFAKLEADRLTPVPIGSKSSLESGPALLLSDVSGKRESYKVQILHVFREGNGRDFLIQVTDPRLLELTGGIVQGMSGSPILQSGKLVGAVTHVLVSDPARGYGISIERMLEAAA